MQSSVLITGAAGFIGFHLARRLADDGWRVFGVDNLNSYYDPNLKMARLNELRSGPNFQFEQCDIADRVAVANLFASEQFPYVIHLAAQAGVAHSLVDPASYVDANLVGFVNILEGCRHSGTQCRHMIYASSSSVYGANHKMPLLISERVDRPLSLYGATKRANELIAYAYSHLFALPVTGLRFFTVYGPWGRPDMAIWLFTEAILKGEPVRLFNHGHMRRDFTYVDDVVESVVRLIAKPPHKPDINLDRQKSTMDEPPWQIFNVGNSSPIGVDALISTLERVIGKPAHRMLLPMRSVDVLQTYADCSDLERVTGFSPKTPIEDGLRCFVKWYCRFHKL